MSEVRNYYPPAAAGVLGAQANNHHQTPDKLVDVPRLEAIANQHHQALLCLQELTVRLGRAADRLLGARPPSASPSQNEVGAIDHSVTHRLRRLGGDTMMALEMLAGEIQRLEEL